MEEVTCERGLGVWAEYQPNTVQVRGEVSQGRQLEMRLEGQAPSLQGFQRQNKESVPNFDRQWVPSRSPIREITQPSRFLIKGVLRSKQCLEY